MSLVVLGASTAAVWGPRYLVGEVAVVEAFNAAPTWIGWPFRIVMQAGTLWVGLVAVALTAWRTAARSWAPTTAVALSVAVAYRLDNVLKAVVERPRPSAVVAGLDVREHIGGFGFPSGHTTMACAIAGALHPIVPTRGRPLLWALAALTALTRMHVGVHWPMDLVGGAALGMAIASAAWLIVGTGVRAARCG